MSDESNPVGPKAPDERPPARASEEGPSPLPPVSRRRLLTATGAGLAAAVLVEPGRALAQMEGMQHGGMSMPMPAGHAAPPAEPARRGTAHVVKDWLEPGRPGRDYQPVTVPNGSKLPWKVVDGVKVFHLVAEEVEHEFAPGLLGRCWGYNGKVHGPTIEVVERDRVRIYVTNRLPAATTVHWHALLLPNGMDGVGGLTQRAIRPGETYKYEFTVRQQGTGMYHSHHDEMTQIALGMTGLVVMHPRKAGPPKVDRDFAILLHEWKILPGSWRPDPNEMIEFNVLSMNAKVFPATEPLVVKKGQRVRIRLGNLSPMEHHPIHLHGHHFRVTETDGGRIPDSAQWPETTVLVPVGSTRTIELVADEPGDWALHCHMTHHVMNQMGHGALNMVGASTDRVDPKVRRALPGYMSMGQAGMAEMGEMKMPLPANTVPMVGGMGKHDLITMGGMFTVMKVREHLNGYRDPGWYDAPPPTTATLADDAELRKDGVDPAARGTVEPG